MTTQNDQQMVLHLMGDITYILRVKWHLGVEIYHNVINRYYCTEQMNSHTNWEQNDKLQWSAGDTALNIWHYIQTKNKIITINDPDSIVANRWNHIPSESKRRQKFSNWHYMQQTNTYFLTVELHASMISRLYDSHQITSLTHLKAKQRANIQPTHCIHRWSNIQPMTSNGYSSSAT